MCCCWLDATAAQVAGTETRTTSTTSWVPCSGRRRHLICIGCQPCAARRRPFLRFHAERHVGCARSISRCAGALSSQSGGQEQDGPTRGCLPPGLDRLRDGVSLTDGGQRQRVKTCEGGCPCCAKRIAVSKGVNWPKRGLHWRLWRRKCMYWHAGKSAHPLRLRAPRGESRSSQVLGSKLRISAQASQLCVEGLHGVSPMIRSFLAVTLCEKSLLKSPESPATSLADWAR